MGHHPGHTWYEQHACSLGLIVEPRRSGLFVEHRQEKTKKATNHPGLASFRPNVDEFVEKMCILEEANGPSSF